MESREAASIIGGLLGIAVLIALFAAFKIYIAGEPGQNFLTYITGFGLPIVLSMVIIVSALIVRHVALLVLDYAIQDYSPNLMKLSKTIVSLAIVFIALILIIAIFTQDHLILSVIIAGVLAICLISSKNAIEDFIVRFQLLLSPLIDIGDYIEVEEEKGKIIDFGLLYTAIRREDKKIVLIPNKDFIQKKVINFSKSPHLRVQDCIELEINMKDALKLLRKLEQAIEGEGFEKQRTWLSQEGEKIKLFACIDIDDPAKIPVASNALTKAFKRVASQHGVG